MACAMRSPARWAALSILCVCAFAGMAAERAAPAVANRGAAKPARTFNNPVLPGFYPDPSICRRGDDYYLVASSFEYFPGLPVFHSRDLVNWRQIGHAIDRPSQIDLDSAPASGGLYAPTIRFHGDTFYIVNTLVLGGERKANFIVTAADPAGPWSQPYWLNDAPGIDPSLFFDDDGRAWYTVSRHAYEGHYRGHTEIRLQEFDCAAMRLFGGSQVLWDGALRGAVYSEGPHIYKIDGWYCLLTAEGGTGHDHAVVVARSKNIAGPFQNNPRNPILTHRHLGLDYPIVGTGHADIVQTQKNEWWMVLLAMRPYGGYFYNCGRETFLASMIWENGWPVVCPGIGRVEFSNPAPDLPEHPWPLPAQRDDFDSSGLALCWNFIRIPRDTFYSLSEHAGSLRLHLKPRVLTEPTNPVFIGRRQQHQNFCAATVMEFSPQKPNECAGMALVQNPRFNFRFVVTCGERSVISLIQCKDGRDSVINAVPIIGKRIFMKAQAHGQEYGFYIAEQPGQWKPVAAKVDGRILSTPEAGGFVGAYIGLYASSNGKASDAHADFDWFEYQGMKNE